MHPIRAFSICSMCKIEALFLYIRANYHSYNSNDIESTVSKPVVQTPHIDSYLKIQATLLNPDMCNPDLCLNRTEPSTFLCV